MKRLTHYIRLCFTSYIIIIIVVAIRMNGEDATQACTRHQSVSQRAKTHTLKKLIYVNVWIGEYFFASLKKFFQRAHETCWNRDDFVASICAHTISVGDGIYTAILLQHDFPSIHHPLFATCFIFYLRKKIVSRRKARERETSARKVFKYCSAIKTRLIWYSPYRRVADIMRCW